MKKDFLDEVIYEFVGIEKRFRESGLETNNPDVHTQFSPNLGISDYLIEGVGHYRVPLLKFEDNTLRLVASKDIDNVDGDYDKYFIISLEENPGDNTLIMRRCITEVDPENAKETAKLLYSNMVIPNNIPAVVEKMLKTIILDVGEKLRDKISGLCIGRHILPYPVYLKNIGSRREIVTFSADIILDPIFPIHSFLQIGLEYDRYTDDCEIYTRVVDIDKDTNKVIYSTGKIGLDFLTSDDLYASIIQAIYCEREYLNEIITEDMEHNKNAMINFGKDLKFLLNEFK